METVLEGFHTKVYVSEAEGCVRKVYGLKTRPFSLWGAVQMILDIRAYDQALRQIGIATPERFGFSLRRHPDRGGLLVVEKAAFIPRSVEEVFQQADWTEVEWTAKAILADFEATFTSGGRVMIDSPASNFRRTDHTVYYVDLMPPRGLIRGRKLIENPRPLDPDIEQFLYQRYCGPRTPLVILNQWCRLRPQNRREFEDLITGFVGKVRGGQAATFFRNRPGRPLTAETIKSFTPWDCDYIRDTACELEFQGRMDAGLRQQVFRLAHIDPGGILPAEAGTAQAKQILLTSLNGGGR